MATPRPRRVAIWSGNAATAERIVRAIQKWDPKGELAKGIGTRQKAGFADVDVVATCPSLGDQDDASAYAEGFADGLADAEEELERDETDDDDDDDDDDDEDDDDDLQKPKPRSVFRGFGQEVVRRGVKPVDLLVRSTRLERALRGATTPSPC